MSDQFATCGGVTIAYRVYGETAGSAIVLVRGLGTQLIDWPDSFIEGLGNAGLKVVVFDNRDAGLSEKFDTRPPYTLKDMAGDVVGLTDHLGIDRFHLLGISMGGMIGQVVAGEYGDRLLSLISVMSSSGRKGLPGPTPAASEVLMAELPGDAAEEDILEIGVKGEKTWGSPGYPQADEELLEIQRRRYQRCYCPAGTGRQMAAVVASGDRSAILQSIEVPTLVIHGEEDTLIPIEAGEDTARQIPGARFVAVPGMGHNIPPGLVPYLLDLVLDFIRR